MNMSDKLSILNDVFQNYRIFLLICFVFNSSNKVRWIKHFFTLFYAE